MAMKFNFKYFYMFIFVFIVELFIAIFINDTFVRPFVGDVLVVILIYLFIRSFFICKKLVLVIFILLFSYMVEIGQYYDLISFLQLQDNMIARVVIGSTFDVMDFFAYTFGAFLLILPNILSLGKNLNSKRNL